MKLNFIRLFYDGVPLNPGTGGLTVASDTIGGQEYQRIKLIHGADGVNAGDVATANPLPVFGPNVIGSGTLSANDAVVAAPIGDGVLKSGTSTAGSYVAVASTGAESSWNVQLSNLTTGYVYFETSMDSTNGVDGNWITVNGRQTGRIETYLNYFATTSGIYRGNVSAVKYFRVRVIGATSPSIGVAIILSGGTGATFLNASTPAGNNQIGKVVRKPNPSDLSQLSIEGGHLDAALTSTIATRLSKVAANNTFASGNMVLVAVGYGRVAWLEEVVVSNQGTIPFSISGNLLESGLGATYNGPLGEAFYEIVPAFGGRAVLRMNRFIQEGTTFAFNLTSVVAGVQPHYAVRPSGISFTDDLNFNAKTRVCLVETSLGYNQMGNDPGGLAYKNKMGYAAQMIAQINLDGKSARLINKAVTSTDTTHWLTLLSSGYLRGFDYELLIVSLGVNDAITGSGITTTAFKANLKEFAYERNRYMPNASIIFEAPPVTDSTTRTANIASFRTAVSEVVTELIAAGYKNIYYYDMSTAFSLNATPASDTNFTNAERVAGSRVHPSGAGNTFIAFGPTGLPSANAGLYGVVKTTDYYKNLA